MQCLWIKPVGKGDYLIWWIEVAEFACLSCRIESLSLKPWQSPPCHIDEDAVPDNDDREPDTVGRKLLRQMLRAGVSRYEPDPIAALQRARRVAENKLTAPSFCISLIAAGLLLLGRQYEVALSLAAGPGTAVNRSLGSPHNPGQLPVVLLALPVGCLQLPAVQAGER
jgi:hypothetical protein